MVFDISQLKKIRKQLDLTQFQFAKKAGISQSMIAKIESNKLDPTYSKVKKIELALELLTKHGEKQAKDIMNKHIISVPKDEKVQNIIKIMNKNAISQVPVMEKENILGLISESSILNKTIKDIKHLKAIDIMESIPPIIDKSTEMNVIKQLLKYYPILFIKEREKISGLITRADLIKNLT